MYSAQFLHPGLEVRCALDHGGVRPFCVPRFFDRKSLRIFEPFAKKLIEGSSEFASEIAWPQLVNFRRDRSMAYFVATVRARNFLGKYFGGELDFAKLMIPKLANKLGIRSRKAICQSFGPLYTGSFSRSHELAGWIRRLDVQRLCGWEPFDCSQILRLIVPIYAEDDSGTIATYPNCKKQMNSIDALVDEEVVHLQLRRGDALIFDALKPMEKLPGQGKALLLEAYIGRLSKSSEWIIWS